MTKAENRTATVYGLASSEDGKIRYVGQTVQPIKHRLFQHECEGRRGKRSHRAHWIRSCQQAGHKILIWEIEANAIWHETEKRLIAWYRKHGARLVNQTDGGEGTLGYRHSGRKRPDLAARNRLGKGKPGHKHTPEAIEKFASKLRGRKRPEVGERNRANAGKPGHKHTPESRAKIAAASKRNWNPERRAKLIEARKATPVTAETRAKMSAARKRIAARKRRSSEAAQLSFL